MSTVFQTAATGSKDAGTTATALQFSLNTNPDPIRVSPSTGDVERADLVIVASRRESGAIECNKIIVVIPTGTNSPELALDLQGIDAQTSLKDWTATTNPTAKTITFAPTSGHATISRDEGITIQLMGVRINRQVGTAPLITQVYSRPAGTSESFQPDITTLEIGKFPADFYLRNLIAKPLIIDNGDTVTLTWEAGGVSSLRLLYDTTDINVLGESTYPVSNVSHTTVFYLRATVQVGNGTAERILSTTATVRVPDLDVGNLFIRGNLSNLRHSSGSTAGPWAQSTVRGLFGDSAPTLFKYNGELHCVGSTFEGQEPRWTTLHGDTWIQMPTTLPPAACEDSDFLEYDKKLYCVYRTPDNAMHQTTGTADPTQPGGLAWSTPTRITGQNWTTTHKPALTWWGPGLYCAFRHPDGAVYYDLRVATGSWGAAKRTTGRTAHAPAAASPLAGPYYAYRSEDGSLQVAMMGETAAPTPIPGVQTSVGPALTSSGVSLGCAYRSESGKLQYTTAIGTSWTPPVDVDPVPVSGTPALASLNNQVHAVYRY